MKNNISPSTLRFRARLHQLFAIRHWNLQTRVVYTTGLLLLAGGLTTLIAVSTALNNSANETITQNLGDFERLAQQVIASRRDQLNSSALQLISNPDFLKSIKQQDSAGIRKTFLFASLQTEQYGTRSFPDIRVITNEGTILFDSDGLSDQLKPLKVQEKSDAPLSSGWGFYQKEKKLRLRTLLWFQHNGESRSIIESSIPLSSLYADFSAILHGPYGLAFIASNRAEFVQWSGKYSAAAWGLLRERQADQLPASITDQITHKGSNYLKTEKLYDSNGTVTGDLILLYDGSEIIGRSRNTIMVLSWLTVFGVLIISLSLYWNVRRIKYFFRRLKKLLVASQAMDFSARLETDVPHCMDHMECGNRECPVYQDHNLVCYLETGDLALAPKYKNSCVALNRYNSCRNCPVYQESQGDELTEMKHLVNTSMGLWSSFLDTVGKLLQDVFKGKTTSMVGLDDISSSLEQIAGLTSFGHDLKGVYNKDEVYKQLEYTFSTTFGLENFSLLEVNPSENRMEPVLGRQQIESSHFEVFLNCDVCRAKRIAEDVSSEHNPHLCPYFGIRSPDEIRCCLPMVMGGRVGAVFTFSTDRSRWKVKKEQMLILKKYLEETAPVLSSLRLLQITKEQALKDPLTHCHNRRFMDQFLVQFEGLNKRKPRNLGFIMADLDHFKMVNDEYGHQAGDEILRQLADILRKNIRQSDLLIRYGGEEFLIILLETEAEGQSEMVAEKLRNAVESTRLNLPDGGYIAKTISMGVAEFPYDGDQLYKVIKFADIALYQAKEQGRNRVLRFKEEMWQEEEY